MRYAAAVKREKERAFLREHPPEPIAVLEIPQGIEAVGRTEVPTESVDLWKHNPIKRSRISDGRLEAWIRAKGILVPLEVVRSGDHWVCIDGNRRLRIARRLGMKTVPITEIIGTPQEIAIILNTTSERWDGQTLGQYIADFPDVGPLVPEGTRRRIEQAQNLLGRQYGEYIIDHSLAPLDAAMAVARYVGRTDDRRFIKNVAYWVARHKLTHRVRAAMVMNISTRVLLGAIERDEPVVI